MADATLGAPAPGILGATASLPPPPAAAAPHDVLPGAPVGRITITPGMQAFYATRGMWADDRPTGVLATMLGPIAPGNGRGPGWVFYVTPQQVDALLSHLGAVPVDCLRPHQRAQFLRRLREAQAEALRPKVARPAPAAAGAAATRPLPALGGASPKPFVPLQRPPSGAAKTTFEDHVMRTLRDFVDFTQSSEWMGGRGE